MARDARLRDHLAVAKKRSFKGLSELYANYLKECAEWGIPSRREQPLVREEANNFMDLCTATKRSSYRKFGRMLFI